MRNHYINLLEPEECHYLSVAESNPAYKLIPVLLVVAVLAGVFTKYQSLQETIAKGADLKARWTEIEEQVEEAKVRAERHGRLERGLQTLQGWTGSRYNWPDMLSYIAKQIPDPKEKVQFTRLYFDEKMVGIRDKSPTGGPVYRGARPRREVSLELRGMIRFEQPELFLGRFQGRLLNGEDAPVNILAVNLDNYKQLPAKEDELTDTAFTFTIELEPRVLAP